MSPEKRERFKLQALGRNKGRQLFSSVKEGGGRGNGRVG